MDHRTQVKVLIVEDQSEVRDTIRLGLRILRNYKFEFLEAGNGIEGLRVLKEGFKPNVIIVDLMMPEMNGFDFIKNVKQTKKYQNVPILVLSARSSGEDISQALQLGAIDFLVKPFEYSALTRMERGIELGLLLDKADNISSLEEKIKDQQDQWDLVSDLEVSRVFKLKYSEKILPLCTLLSSYFPEAKRNILCMGINEIILNAIIHGNLEVDSVIKAQDNGGKLFESKIKERQQLEPYKDRVVIITLVRTDQTVSITIFDEGPGFDPSSVQDPAQSPDCLFLPYGRGIVMTQFAFDEVKYDFPKEGGTLATLIKNIPESAT